MPDRPDIRSFTARYPALARELRTREVGISTIEALASAEETLTVQVYSAIWDTGATHTNITTRVVRECGLIPTGQVDHAGVHGTRRSNVYPVVVYLPNQVYVRDVEVVETTSLPGGDDILIGMDIIGLGDFAVSNYRGKTTFTFRIPSQEEIDFSPPVPKVGR